MLQFQVPGFGQRVIEASLGVMVYYTPTSEPWRSPTQPESERPALVFLHSLGGGSSAYEWSKIYPAFAPDYRVIVPDLIGWGQSTHPTRDYRVEDYLTMVTELLEQTNAVPATVVASSLTAGMMVRLAIQRPDLFERLILVSPSGYSDFGADFSSGLPAQLTRIPGLDRLIYTVGAANEVAVSNFLAQFIFADPNRITSETVQAYLTSAQQLNAEYAALASLKGNLCFDLSRYFGQLSVPTVLIWGECSRFNSPEVGRRLQQLNPTMVQGFHLVPNTGVLPHLELPAVVIGLLGQYLGKPNGN